MPAQTINEALTLIFRGIERLHEAFPSRAFTIDGRLVGDIGEVIAELEYDLTLDKVSAPDHDAQMRDGRRVQIKATFKDSLTFKKCPDYYLGFKLYPDGTFDEVFNGPNWSAFAGDARGVGAAVSGVWQVAAGGSVAAVRYPKAFLRDLFEAYAGRDGPPTCVRGHAGRFEGAC